MEHEKSTGINPHNHFFASFSYSALCAASWLGVDLVSESPFWQSQAKVCSHRPRQRVFTQPLPMKNHMLMHLNAHFKVPHLELLSTQSSMTANEAVLQVQSCQTLTDAGPRVW